jgi:hypothetical protein
MKKKKKLLNKIVFENDKNNEIRGEGGEVTNAKNIKADRPKILRPTHFSCMKDIKAEKLVVGAIP